MKSLWWKITGRGNYHLILLHGWGMNSGVWYTIEKKLSLYFTLHLVDLPGFGKSQSYGVLSLDDMVQCVLEKAPKKAIWLGWSLGGLLASQIALSCPERVQALVNVTSSPCFSARKSWPGIKPEVLSGFQKQLINDFYHTVEHFLVLQTMGTKTAWKDAHTLNQIVFSCPIPTVEVLNGGLEILKTTDLRERLTKISQPHLRIYGYLDSLIPRKISLILDKLYPNSESLVIPKAAHIPFISHPDEFITALMKLIQNLD